ncbi:MAG: type II toxin-antitoxin system HicB family antitoxin [Turicibacter sp.]|nr:type II toxin-antitoxin system HicB family antitoxin [Turicibacter sp.]
MLLKAYPATFTPEEDGGYFIQFPDVKGAYTGINEDDIAFGLSMAEEVLGLVLSSCIEDNEPIPNPSDINKLTAPPGGFVTMVKVDLEEYLKDTTPVKKTLTIPKWVNDLGNRCSVNFSKVLTNAIVAENLNRK